MAAHRKSGYDFAEIEGRWAARWRAENSGRAPRIPGRPKRYVLDMFPYPSGETHMGHVRNYTIGDVLSRFYRARGYDVLHPIGYDAFGLPAENAAMRHGVSPEEWTLGNIGRFNDAYQRLGYSYDWDRSVTTCQPDYYRWSQWLFLRLLERDLAYRRASVVQWCPSCRTVLANEQIVGGVCWRCSSTPEPRELEQWFLRTTAYAQRLLDDAADLEWSEAVLSQQRNWIGRSEGCELTLEIDGTDETVTVYTTRPDTLWGVTFVALAPDHPLAAALAERAGDAGGYARYLERTRTRTEIERVALGGEQLGFDLRCKAVHPVTGALVPVLAADYVLASYGTGAIMGVPAHDARDLSFARRYGLPVRVVVTPDEQPVDADAMVEAYTDPGVLVNSGEFDGMRSTDALPAIVRYLEERGIGKGSVRYRLRDWLISRQRYWGTPIPVVHCPSCGVVPVPDEQLPVLLPADVDYALDESTASPLANAVDWVKTSCPRCAGPASRETDTMDTFIDSSWYFLRFCDPHNEQRPFDSELVDAWLPVDQYTGGVEHAVGHLIYARFFTKFLYDIGLIHVKEPFQRLLNQGTITLDGRAMSKSSGHNVDPSAILEAHGADALRLFILFIGPPDHAYDWPRDQVQIVVGARRFLERVWNLVTTPAANDTTEDPELRLKVHRHLRAIIDDYTEQRLNTVVSSLMSLQRELSAAQQAGADVREGVHVLLHALAPICPFIAEELWTRLGNEDSIHGRLLPEPDEELLRQDTTLLLVQVDGTVRDRITVPTTITADEAEQAALASPAVRAQLGATAPVRVISRPPRLVNLVTRRR